MPDTCGVCGSELDGEDVYGESVPLCSEACWLAEQRNAEEAEISPDDE